MTDNNPSISLRLRPLTETSLLVNYFPDSGTESTVITNESSFWWFLPIGCIVLGLVFYISSLYKHISLFLGLLRHCF